MNQNQKQKYNNTKYFSNIDFESMEKIFYKIYDHNNKYVKIELLTKSEIIKIQEAYNLLKTDIEKFINNNYKNNNYNYIEKTIKAWERFIYIKDRRNITQLIQNVEKGWEFEDFIYSKAKKYRLNIKYNGKDKDRMHSLFDFNSTPDLLINNKKVEVQYGNNNFFKQNKINKCIKEKAFILYYSEKIKKFYIFNTYEIENINKNETIIKYGNKKGKEFKIENYQFSDIKSTLLKYFLPKKEKMIKI